MSYPSKNLKKTKDHWASLHLPTFYSSLFFATIIFLVFLFFVNPPTSITLERKILLYVGAYLVFLALGELVHYAFFYLPNYVFYKRMVKDGRDDEIKDMIEAYGIKKLIRNNWFIYKENSGLESHKNIQSKNKAGEE